MGTCYELTRLFNQGKLLLRVVRRSGDSGIKRPEPDPARRVLSELFDAPSCSDVVLTLPASRAHLFTQTQVLRQCGHFQTGESSSPVRCSFTLETNTDRSAIDSTLIGFCRRQEDYQSCASLGAKSCGHLCRRSYRFWPVPLGCRSSGRTDDASRHRQRPKLDLDRQDRPQSRFKLVKYGEREEDIPLYRDP